MAEEYRTDTAGFARRVAQFEIEDVHVHLAYDPRLRFYIPKRWWTSERFDTNVHLTGHSNVKLKTRLPHLEVHVGKKQITIYRPTHRLAHVEIELLCECLDFARRVLAEA